VVFFWGYEARRKDSLSRSVQLRYLYERLHLQVHVSMQGPFLGVVDACSQLDDKVHQHGRVALRLAVSDLVSDAIVVLLPIPEVSVHVGLSNLDSDLAPVRYGSYTYQWTGS